MIESDYALVAGLVLAWLGLPALVSAYAHRHRPLFAAFLFLSGAGLIALAVLTRDGGYELSELPEVFFRVLAQMF